MIKRLEVTELDKSVHIVRLSGPASRYSLTAKLPDQLSAIKERCDDFVGVAKGYVSNRGGKRYARVTCSLKSFSSKTLTFRRIY